MLNQLNQVLHHLRMTQKANANLLKAGMNGTAGLGFEENEEENEIEETEGQGQPNLRREIFKFLVVIIGVVAATPIVFLGVMYVLDKKGVDVESEPYKPLLPLTQAELFTKNAPPELADCSLSVFNGMKIVRCPNSTTSTQYRRGKNSNENMILIDNNNQINKE